jgi:hypothetical protein
MSPLPEANLSGSFQGALGETPEQRAATYRRLFQFELDEEDLQEIRSTANGGFALGN